MKVILLVLHISNDNGDAMDDALTELSDRVRALENDMSVIIQENKRLHNEIDRLKVIISDQQAVAQQPTVMVLSGHKMKRPSAPVVRAASTAKDKSKLARDPVGSSHIPGEKRELYFEEEMDEYIQSDIETLASDDSSYCEPKSAATSRSKKKSKKQSPGAKKRAKTTSAPRMQEYHLYRCPIQGCGCEFHIPGNLHPPLDENGFVSDRIGWPRQAFRHHANKIRKHMKNVHPNVPASAYPPGFAYVKSNVPEAAAEAPAPAAATSGETGKEISSQAGKQKEKGEDINVERDAEPKPVTVAATIQGALETSREMEQVSSTDDTQVVATASASTKIWRRILPKYKYEKNQPRQAENGMGSPIKSPSKPAAGSATKGFEWDSDSTFIF